MRTIDADALKEAFTKSSHIIETVSGLDVMEMLAIKEIIDNAPTIPLPDFKEGYKQAIIDGKTNFSRPTGEWINNVNGTFECSRCGVKHSKANYCPNCGAKMKNTNKESEERNMTETTPKCAGEFHDPFSKMPNEESEETKMEMTVEQYRERMIQAFQNTGCEELIALVALPNEEAFKNLENDLRNCWPSWYKREADSYPLGGEEE